MSYSVSRTADDALAQLRAGLTYRGPAQYGSCIQQATCNVLEAQGLRGAADLIGMSWGFSYRAGNDRLRGAERWLPAVARLSGLELHRPRFSSADSAFEAERAALQAGAPVVVAVDSFDITSPYQGRANLMHALVLVEWGADGVTVLDPMNEPRPTHLALDVYRRTRASAVVPGFDMIVSHGPPGRAYSALDALAELHADAITHREICVADLDAFILAVEAGRVAPDVADVAAERTYAQRLMAIASTEVPELAPLAAKIDTLARRWYFAHAIGIENDTRATQRMARILRDLRERETRLLDELAGTMSAIGLAPAPDGAIALNLAGFLRSVLTKQTQVTVDGLSATDDLWAAGLTSLESVRMMMDIEDELGVEFPPSMLNRSTFRNLAAIEGAINSLLAGSTASVEVEARE
jgi:acyl carrier protein